MSSKGPKQAFLNNPISFGKRLVDSKFATVCGCNGCAKRSGQRRFLPTEGRTSSCKLAGHSVNVGRADPTAGRVRGQGPLAMIIIFREGICVRQSKAFDVKNGKGVAAGAFGRAMHPRFDDKGLLQGRCNALGVELIIPLRGFCEKSDVAIGGRLEAEGCTHGVGGGCACSKLLQRSGIGRLDALVVDGGNGEGNEGGCCSKLIDRCLQASGVLAVSPGVGAEAEVVRRQGGTCRKKGDGMLQDYGIVCLRVPHPDGLCVTRCIVVIRRGGKGGIVPEEIAYGGRPQLLQRLGEGTHRCVVHTMFRGLKGECIRIPIGVGGPFGVFDGEPGVDGRVAVGFACGKCICGGRKEGKNRKEGRKAMPHSSYSWDREWNAAVFKSPPGSGT